MAFFSHHFVVGILSYADDIVLLAPSLNAHRIQLSICEQSSKDYHLQFNSVKTQLIFFTYSRLTTLLVLYISLVILYPFETLFPLFTTLWSADLNDSDDISNIIKELYRKANCVLQTFSQSSPVIKTFVT